MRASFFSEPPIADSDVLQRPDPITRACYVGGRRTVRAQAFKTMATFIKQLEGVSYDVRARGEADDRSEDMRPLSG